MLQKKKGLYNHSNEATEQGKIFVKTHIILGQSLSTKGSLLLFHCFLHPRTVRIVKYWTTRKSDPEQLSYLV